MRFQAVDNDSDQDDGAIDDILHVGLDAGEVHAVIYDSDDECAYQCS